MRGRGERDMALAAEQPGGRVEADPARARDVGFRPGVEVGEVGLGAARAVDRRRVRLQLDQVAGHEAGREAEPAQDLDEEPRRIAARAAGCRERLLRRLHARLHAHEVAHLGGEHGVQRDQELDGVRLAGQAGEEVVEARRAGVRQEIGAKLGVHLVRVCEGERLRVLLHEEVERVDHRHVGREVDLDAQLGRLLGEDDAREPVPVRVLLPVHEVVRGRDLEGVARDLGARVGRGTQPDRLRPQRDGTVGGVRRQVVEGGDDRHGCSVTPGCAASLTPRGRVRQLA